MSTTKAKLNRTPSNHKRILTSKLHTCARPKRTARSGAVFLARDSLWIGHAFKA